MDQHPLVHWQGKEGPCLLLRWREGVAAPSHEGVDEEWRLSETQLQGIRLPPTCTISSFDCPVHSPLTATCTTVEGVWSTTTLEKPHVYRRDGDTFRQALQTVAVAQGVKPARSSRRREFILIDLGTQMRFLPPVVHTWPRERLLAWLQVWGEVHEVTGGVSRRHVKDTHVFCSWAGRWTSFALTDDGQLVIPETPDDWAWPDEAE